MANARKKKVITPEIKAELILKWWENGDDSNWKNYRELELSIGELEMGKEWAKELDLAGCKPKLYSRTWDGKFEVFYGDDFLKEKQKKETKKKPPVRKKVA